MMRRTLFSTILVFLAGIALASDKNVKPPEDEPAPTTQSSRARVAPEMLLDALGEGVKLIEEEIPGGWIDWTRGQIVVVGTGKAKGARAKDIAMAKRAARVVAARNAVLLMAGIRTGPGGKFSNIETGQIRVDATARGLEELSTRFDRPTLTATVKLRMPLNGPKGVVNITGMVVDKTWRRWAWPKPEGEAAAPVLVVVDARGTSFAPCMFPRLVTEAGECVFDASDVDIAELKRRGLAVYAAAKIGAKLLAEPTSRPVEQQAAPLVLTAAKPENDSRALVLDAKALEALRRCPQAREAMKAGRLLIVIASSDKAETSD